MSYYVIEQIRAPGNISARICTEVIAAEGDDHLESLTLRDTSTGATETVAAQWLFLFIGAAPLTEWLDRVVVRDARGFVLAGPALARGGQRPPRRDPDRLPRDQEASVPGGVGGRRARPRRAQPGRP